MWPKCEWQDGGKYCWRGKVAWAPHSEDDKPMVTDKDCPVCNGTGEAAELTADQAADVLTTCQITFSWVDDGYYLTVWRGSNCIWTNEGAEVNFPTLTKALNAAAQAAKERGKE